MEEHEGDDDQGLIRWRCSPSSRVGVAVDVGLAGEGDPDAVDGVVEDRQVDQAPLDAQQDGEVVDLVDLHLIDIGFAELSDGGVDEQVDDEVAAEDDAGEGMEPTEEEMMPLQRKRRRSIRNQGSRHSRQSFPRWTDHYRGGGQEHPSLALAPIHGVGGMGVSALRFFVMKYPHRDQS